MAGQERQRVAIEDLREFPASVRSTAVRIGESATLVSTVKILPVSQRFGYIETFTGRIDGIDVIGLEGSPVFSDRKFVPLTPFSKKFKLSELEEATEFHAQTVAEVADIMEDNPYAIYLLELRQLLD